MTKTKQIWILTLTAALALTEFSGRLSAGELQTELELEWSLDLQDWESAPVTPDMLNDSNRILKTTNGDERVFFRLRIRAGESNATPIRFIRIPAGTFTMGSPPDEPGRYEREGPQHSVTITQDFYLTETPVTWNQWIKIRQWAAANGYTEIPIGYKGSHGDHRNSGNEPATMASWWDAVHWLNAWSEMDGRTPVYYSSPDFGEENILRTGGPVYADWSANGYRLPTEAEWEYACRAGTTTAYYTGPITYTGNEPLDTNLDRAGWYGGNSDQRSQPVALKEANAWGLYDMHGLVWEWCWNYSESYSSTAKTDPRGPVEGTNRIRRGGSWTHDANRSRSAFRVISAPFGRLNYTGFRPALNAEPQ